jgi:integrase
MAGKQRKRGMGSIFKHGSSWWIALYDHGKKVKGRAGPIGLITKSQAEQALKARMGEIVQGRFSLEKPIKMALFDKMAERYLEYSKANHRSYKRSLSVSKVLLRFFGGKKLTDVSTWSVENFKVERKNEGKTLSNINRELTVLKRMFNLAIEWGLTSSNPVKRVKFFKVNNEPMRVLTEEEFSKLCEAASPHLKPVLLCAVSTGLRRSELLNLLWSDVDLKKDTITVRDSKNYDFRIISINPALKEELNRIKEDTSSQYVFGFNGHPVKEIKRSFETALRKSGIPVCRFHDLRHTFATTLVMKGVDLATLQELLGHKSILMTKRFSHPTLEHKKKAVESLDFKPNNPTTNTKGSDSTQLVNVSDKLQA